MKPDSDLRAVKRRVSSVEGLRLEYTLFRSEKKIGGRYSYSLALEEDHLGEHSSAAVSDISRSKRRAEEVYRLVSGGNVTVCTLFEVMEDLL